MAARGLFLHNEFAQPRRRDPAAGAHDDPQHFEMARCAAALDRLRDALSR